MIKSLSQGPQEAGGHERGDVRGGVVFGGEIDEGGRVAAARVAPAARVGGEARAVVGAEFGREGDGAALVRLGVDGEMKDCGMSRNPDLTLFVHTRFRRQISERRTADLTDIRPFW